jgi:polysaccharide chain length determinant protein (PEP-CTERM system associated)
MSQDEAARGMADPGAGAPEPEESSFSWNQVQHLIHAPLRRPLAVVVPWLTILALSVAVLFVLPKKYRSSTLILRESEKLPASFVPKVATEESVRRISDIRSAILSRTRLEAVIGETNPYPEITSMTRAVDTMRENTWVNSSGSDGFTVEFIHHDPNKAQEVASRLVALFVEETVKAREQQVEDAVDFLVTQVKDARAELEKKDAALRRFKEDHMGRLPEQLQTNLTTMEMLQREMQTVEESLYLAREKRDALARNAGRPSTVPADGPTRAESNDLDVLRGQLMSLRSRYTDQHPDVETLRSRIARAEARLAEAQALQAQSPAAQGSEVGRAQLQAASQEVEKLSARQADLERRIATIRARVEETPRTEQELSNLTRDYNKLSDNYTALLSKQLEAQMAGRLEQRWKGDRFRVLDPAHLPEKPDSPRPKRIIALGLLAGLFAGLGLALLLEILDPTVKDVQQLETLLPYPVLARIPHLPDARESAR